MSPIHHIRLKGPWQYAWLEPAFDSLPKPVFAQNGTVKLPLSWSDIFGETAGRVCWTRRFQRPTNLEPHERVRIAIAEIEGRLSVSLNGESCPVEPSESGGVRIDVTDWLSATNLLEIETTHDSTRSAVRSGLFSSVLIEIDSST